MREYFFKTLTYVSVMLIFAAIGVFLRAFKIVKAEASETVSKLIVWVFLPLYTFRLLSRNFTVGIIESKLSFFITGVLVLAILFLVALILARFFAKGKDEEGIYIYGFSAPNFSYMGFVMVEAILGETALSNAVIFSLGLCVFIGSVGIYLITPGKKTGLLGVINPVIIATLVGMIFGLCRFPVNTLASEVIDAGTACLMPLVMIVVGMVAAEKSFFKLFTNFKVYVAAAIRLVAIPMLLYWILKSANISYDIIVVAVAIMGMPTDFNTIIFPKAFGGNSVTGAQLAIITNLLSLATLPFIFHVL